MNEERRESSDDVLFAFPGNVIMKAPDVDSGVIFVTGITENGVEGAIAESGDLATMILGDQERVGTRDNNGIIQWELFVLPPATKIFVNNIRDPEKIDFSQRLDQLSLDLI